MKREHSVILYDRTVMRGTQMISVAGEDKE